MAKLLKFFQLSFAEKIFFFRALQLLAYFRIGLKCRSLPNIFSEVEKKSKIAALRSQSTLQAKRISQLIAVASTYIPYSTCFSKALAGKILFLENGYAAHLHIGVAKDIEKGFAAHAWLTLNNEIVLCNLPDILHYEEMPLRNMESCR